MLRPGREGGQTPVDGMKWHYTKAFAVHPKFNVEIVVITFDSGASFVKYAYLN